MEWGIAFQGVVFKPNCPVERAITKICKSIAICVTAAPNRLYLWLVVGHFRAVGCGKMAWRM